MLTSSRRPTGSRWEGSLHGEEVGEMAPKEGPEEAAWVVRGGTQKGVLLRQEVVVVEVEVEREREEAGLLEGDMGLLEQLAWQLRHGRSIRDQHHRSQPRPQCLRMEGPNTLGSLKGNKKGK